MGRVRASRPVPGPGASQVLPTPGGCDSGRLGLSVRTWLAEAATAADLKGESGGAKPPQEKKLKLVFGCLNLGESRGALAVAHAASDSSPIPVPSCM